MTAKLILSLEALAAQYRTIILAGRPEETGFEWGQLVRVNEAISYLEDRLAR